MKTLITNAVLTDAGGTRDGKVLIRDGRIEKVYKPGSRIRAKYDSEIDAGGLTLMPGFIDTHSHLRDPGLTYKEDLTTGLRAAVKGGFTTVTAMANTKPVTDTAEKVADIKSRAKEVGLADVNQVCALTKDFGSRECVDFPSVVAETRSISIDGHNVDDAEAMAEGLRASQEYDFILMCHEEPETETVVRDIGLLRENGGHLHICHISKKATLDAIAEAKKEGLDITCEVTPHHLYASGLEYRVHPPFRTWNDRRALIAGCAAGTIDTLGTDHAPHSEEDKAAGSPGINNYETAFGMYHTVFSKAGIPLSRLSEMASAKPAQRLGMKAGLIKEGYPADLVLVDPSEEWQIRPKAFVSKSHNTPFGGDWILGRVHKTIKSGQVVYDAEAEEPFNPIKAEKSEETEQETQA